MVPVIYLDTSFVIRWVEHIGAFGERARQLVADEGADRVSASRLVALECLILPLRTRDTVMEAHYRRLFDGLTILPITDAVYEEAARLRAAHLSLRTADALHWATAKLGGCTSLWTGDAGLTKLAGPFARNVFAST